MKFRKLISGLVVLSTVLCSCDECLKSDCLNGGRCINGECLCEDGVSRPICIKDTCIKPTECINGHCEYGNCVCDEYWIGEACDSLTYVDHSGEYFGSFTCNNYSITTDIVEVTKTEYLDTFWIYELETQYRYKAGFVNVNKFEIPLQRETIDGGDRIRIRGNGDIRKGIITMSVNYTFYDEFGYTYGYTDCDFEGDEN